MSSIQMVIPEKIKIIDCRVVNAVIECPFELSSTDIEKFQSNLEFDIGVNETKKLVKADLKISIVTHSKGQLFDEGKSDIHLVFVYHIENLEELVTRDSKKVIKVHAELAKTIASISYSTSRGILMTRLQGTALKDFILPVIHPEKLLNPGKISK